MGNCFVSRVKSLSPSTTCSSSPGTRTVSTTTTTRRLSSTESSSSYGRQSTGDSTNCDDVNLDGRILESPNLKVFTFAELKAATRNFRPETILGEGGFGTVYKGWVDEKTLNPTKSGLGMVVAVKKLNHESMQGFQEWQSEVNFLGRLSHPNLVRLLGYCWEERELLLVYEFLSKGSLENHLFRRGSAFDPLSWRLRLKILIGAARGLAFLHTSERQIIYRDFKASNILLDSNYNPKLSDFGLAKNGPTGEDSHVTTRVIGTYGYAAPEYVATGHLYVKSDVYGYGVVLLEMLSGQRALDTSRPNEQHNFVEWAKPLLADRRRLARIMDPRLEGQYPLKGALQAAQLTLKCLAADPKNRPSMKEVLENLERIEAMKCRSNDQSRDMVTQRYSTAIHGNGRAPAHPQHHPLPLPSGTIQEPDTDTKLQEGCDKRSKLGLFD